MWKFVTSSLSEKTWHDTKGSIQLVFWGRSNVGKSSLLNSLTNQKIAFVSKTPGRTQLINFFKDNNDKYIVDLPGYGYAKMPKNQQENMLKSIKKFLEFNINPKHLFLLIDSRTSFTKIDLEVLAYIKYINIHFSIVYTKIDKLNQKEKSQLIKKHNQLLNEGLIDENTETFIVSSEKNINIDELATYMQAILYPEQMEVINE